MRAVLLVAVFAVLAVAAVNLDADAGVLQAADDVSALKAQVASLTSQVGALKGQLTAVNAQCSRDKDQLNKAIAEARSKETSANNAAAAHKREADAARARADSLTKDVANLKNAVQAYVSHACL